MLELTTSYLYNLNNANHVGVTTQIKNEAVAFETENAILANAVAAVTAAIGVEDIAYVKSQKDWNVDRLKKEDTTMDDLMKGIRSILAGHSVVPEGYPLKQPAKELLQMWKDYDYKTNDSYSGDSSKVLNMWQEVSARQSDAEALGVFAYFRDAKEKAELVQQLLGQRFEELSGRVAGELKEARQATDAAIKQLYLVLNSMQVLESSPELTALVRVLKTIEEYARQYYIKGGNANNGGGSGSGGSQGGGGTNASGEPGGGETPTPDPGTGGGEEPGGSGGEEPVNPDPGNGGGDTPGGNGGDGPDFGDQE